MSDKLAVSAAISVLMMAGYVLLGTDSTRAPIGPANVSMKVEASIPALPEAADLLPLLR